MSNNPDNHVRKRVTDQWGLDPFPWYEKMLHSNPVHYDEEEQVWDLFRYNDVKQALLSGQSHLILGTGSTSHVIKSQFSKLYPVDALYKLL